MAISVKYLSLEDLEPALRNPKRHSDEDIVASISRFGYVEPIVKDERTGRMVAGHGRVEALKRLHAQGGPPPAGITAKNGTWKVPVVHGWSSKDDREAEAYTVASNRLTEVGAWDDEALAELLSEWQAEDVSFDGLGFSDGDLRDLLAKGDIEGSMDPFAKPDHAVPDDVAAAAADGKPKGDGNWFYVEFYGRDELFTELRELLAGHLNGAHEITAEHFEEIIRAYHSGPSSSTEA